MNNQLKSTGPSWKVEARKQRTELCGICNSNCMYFLDNVVWQSHIYSVHIYCLHNHFISPVIELQCFKCKMASKFVNLYFWPLFCTNFGPFSALRARTTHLCPIKYRFGNVFTTTFSVQIWIYSVSNGRIGLKIGQLVLSTFNLSKFWPFLHVWEPLRSTYAFQSTFWYCFLCTNILFSPFMDWQNFKWTIILNIDFVFVTFILPKFCPFACLRAPTTLLCFSTYIFGIVLFAQTLFSPVMELQCSKCKISPKYTHTLTKFWCYKGLAWYFQPQNRVKQQGGQNRVAKSPPNNPIFSGSFRYDFYTL